ncbi:acyl-CoA carboxylase epsilon subunit [Kocuria marina]|uniref:acyl-CoA carboxylase epsilon subunit n=1 Tax=Kocuria marina TaxID=223184 RepID=UPI003F20C61E
MSPAENGSPASHPAGNASRPAHDPGTAAVAALPETTSHQDALFTVTHGNPTPEELAALTVVFAAQAAAQDAQPSRVPKPPRSQTRRLRLGLRLRPGRGAWRRTLPDR